MCLGSHDQPLKEEQDIVGGRMSAGMARATESHVVHHRVHSYGIRSILVMLGFVSLLLTAISPLQMTMSECYSGRHIFLLVISVMSRSRKNFFPSLTPHDGSVE